MDLLITTLAYQRARDEGRKDPNEADIVWAKDNLSLFENNKCELGFCEVKNENRDTV